VTEPPPPIRAPAGGWRQATIRTVDHPTPTGVRLALDVPDRVDHLPGQHYVVRLTAPDGYVAQRSYSVASAPSEPGIEVSGYLADVALPGDTLDIRGPIGGWFVWRGDTPAVAIGGGSGVVPLVAMLRHASHTGRSGLLRLAVSARRLDELPYADLFTDNGALIATTREGGRDGRAAARLSAAEVASLDDGAHDATWYVCGSAAFAEAMTDLIVAAGIEPERVRVERFGPTS
jgi:ferredoxin-NADP reductase